MNPSYRQMDASASTVDTHPTFGPEELSAKSLPRNIPLGLNRTYAADWSVQDALRELYQNW